METPIPFPFENDPKTNAMPDCRHLDSKVIPVQRNPIKVPYKSSVDHFRLQHKKEDQKAPLKALYSLEAEEAVLGCFLVEPEKSGDLCQAMVRNDEFFTPQYQVLFEVLVNMFNNNLEIGIVEVHQVLADRGLADNLNSPNLLGELCAGSFSIFRLRNYLEIVRGKAVLRLLHKAAEEIIENALDPHEGIDVILGRAESLLDKVMKRQALGSVQASSIKTAPQAVEGFLAKLEEIEKGDQIARYPIGFRLFDQLFSGLPVGGYTVIAARPGEGKTSMGVNMLQNFCANSFPIQTGIISLEMKSDDLIQNCFAYMGEIDSRHFDEKLSAEKKAKVRGIAPIISKWNMRIQECDEMNVPQLKLAFKELHRQGCKVIILDYLQLLTGDQELKRSEQIAEMTRIIKVLSKSLNICTILLAQVNREGAKAGEEVSNHHLKDAGSIEQDAEMVIFLTRLSEPQPFERTRYRLKVDKNRRGVKGSMDMYFDGPWLRFFEERERL